MPRRWTILVIVLLVYVFALMVIGTLFVRIVVSTDIGDLAPATIRRDMVEAVAEPGWWLWAGVIALVFVFLQMAFVVPLLARNPPMGLRPKRLMLSLATAVLLSGAMLAAFAATLAEVIRHYFSAVLGEQMVVILLTLFVVASWIGWSFALYVFTRNIWPDRAIARMIGLMLGGTIVETVTVIPLDIMIRRKTDCYCFSGSFLSLCMSGFVLMWLAGPGFVLALTAKKHRLWRERHCSRCGYSKGPSPGERCPECGFAWRIGQ